MSKTGLSIDAPHDQILLTVAQYAVVRRNQDSRVELLHDDRPVLRLRTEFRSSEQPRSKPAVVRGPK